MVEPTFLPCICGHDYLESSAQADVCHPFFPMPSCSLSDGAASAIRMDKWMRTVTDGRSTHLMLL